MKDLIEALTILIKYANDVFNPVGCGYEELFIGCGIEKSDVSDSDLKRLEELTFTFNNEANMFSSIRFGEL